MDDEITNIDSKPASWCSGSVNGCRNMPHHALMEHISTVHKPKSSSLCGGAIGQILTYLRGLMLFESFILSTALQRWSHLTSKKSLWLRCSIQHVRIHDLFFKWFSIVPLPYKNSISTGSEMCVTSSFGTKKLFKSF